MAILVWMKWYHIVVVPCMSLITNNDDSSVLVDNLHISFELNVTWLADRIGEGQEKGGIQFEEKFLGF